METEYTRVVLADVDKLQEVLDILYSNGANKVKVNGATIVVFEVEADMDLEYDLAGEFEEERIFVTIDRVGEIPEGWEERNLEP